MSFSNIPSHPSPLFTLVMLLCIFGPFVAIQYLPRQRASPAPVLAVLFGVGLSVFILWRGIYMTLAGMPRSGSGFGAATAAGFAEALAGWFLWFMPLGIITIAALIRRSRPALDVVTAVIAIVLLILTAYALEFAAAPIDRVEIVYGAMIVAVVAAVAAWVELVRRRERPLIRYGVLIAILAFGAMTYVVHQRGNHYLHIATYGAR